MLHNYQILNMKKIVPLLVNAFVIILFCSFSLPIDADPPVYKVVKLKRPMKIDANWDKREWKKVPELAIANYMGQIPSFQPLTKAKMMYDSENIYIIFKVLDNFVRLKTQGFNGKVFEDACVEFFFAPDSNLPLSYFNLEMNAGGTALMGFHPDAKTTLMLEPEDFEPVVVAHSMPENLENEITEPVTWTVEYKLPISVLKKFSKVTNPASGTIWKANFFKTSSRSSNPHYVTWSFVDNKTPQFHLPQFFGTLKFK